MSHPFNPDLKVLSEAFWWVNPQYRKSRAGLMLLNSYVSIGKKNFHWIVMTLEHHSPVRQDTLIKRGFQPKETSFILEA